MNQNRIFYYTLIDFYIMRYCKACDNENLTDCRVDYGAAIAALSIAQHFAEKYNIMAGGTG